MAILSRAPSAASITALRGVVDMYYCKGQYVARAWPRLPRHPRTRKQVAGWSAFRAMMAYRTGMPDDWRLAWALATPPPYRRTEDLIRSELRLLAVDPLPDFYPVLGSVHYLPGPIGGTSVIVWADDGFGPDWAGRLTMRARAVLALPAVFPYVSDGIGTSRQRVFIPRSRPDWRAFSLASSVKFFSSPNRLVFGFDFAASRVQAWLTMASGTDRSYMLSPPVDLSAS